MLARAAAVPETAAAGGRGGGYFAMPRELWRDAMRLLTPGQRFALVALVAEANYSPGEVPLPDGSRVRLERGEVLVCSRSFAKRHGIGRRIVREALARLRALGWAETRPARGPPLGPGVVQRRAQGDGPPPTVVRFNVYRDIVWPESDGGPPRGPTARPRGRPEEGPIQQGVIQQEPFRTSGPAEAFHEGVAQLLGVEAEALATSKRGNEGETLRRVTAAVNRLGLPRALEVAEGVIRGWQAKRPDDPISSLAFFVDSLEKAKPARKANGVPVRLPRKWWLTHVPPGDLEAFLKARERLSPVLGCVAPVEVTQVEGVEVPGARELLDGLRQKAIAAARAAA